MPEPIVDQMPRVERDDSDHPVFIHACGDVPVRRTILPLSRETGWWWEDENTLKPSIHCLTCGTHGWWTDGRWEAV